MSNPQRFPLLTSCEAVQLHHLSVVQGHKGLDPKITICKEVERSSWRLGGGLAALYGATKLAVCGAVLKVAASKSVATYVRGLSRLPK
jgi:hypothetical protein